MVSYLIKGRRDCAFIVVRLFPVRSSGGLFCLCVFSLVSMTADIFNAADVCKVFRWFCSSAERNFYTSAGSLLKENTNEGMSL